MSDVDSAKLYVRFFRPYQNKGKVQLGDPKSGRGGLRERSLMRAFYYKV